MTAVVDGRYGSLQGAQPPCPVDLAVADLSAGRMVVVFDEAAGEGVLLLAAAAADKRNIAMMVRHTSGLLRAAMTGAALDRLEVPPMLPCHERHDGNRFAVAVDARCGITTGISAADRARTFRVLADPASRPGDLIRPGHVIPERAVAGGVLERPGRAEAAVDLSALAGLAPVGVIGELVDDYGRLLPFTESRSFASQHAMGVVSIADLVAHRRLRDAA